MRVVVVTPPVPVVTWEDADAHLKLDGDISQQGEVEAMIAAATGHIDGPDGWLGRAIGVQTLEARLDGFEAAGTFLPYRPVIDLVSVTYIDAAGAEQAVAADDYDLYGVQVAPAWSKGWPVARGSRESVRIRYRAGYEVVPAPIRSAILLMVGDLYRNRGEAVIGTISARVEMSTTVAALLSPFRVFY
jgi:uncharacterized phiE125 gp8 family phage protein